LGLIRFVDIILAIFMDRTVHGVSVLSIHVVMQELRGSWSGERLETGLFGVVWTALGFTDEILLRKCSLFLWKSTGEDASERIGYYLLGERF
jgi:hypothetical protein